MKRKAFFLESKLPVRDWACCDKCGLKIKDVQNGKCFWNPNRRARDRNICQNCHDVWQQKREDAQRHWKEKNNHWQEKHVALEHPVRAMLKRVFHAIVRVK